MALDSVVSWGALALSILLLVLLLLQTRRVSRLEKRYSALSAGLGSGAERLSLMDIVATQGGRLDATREDVEKLKALAESHGIELQRSIQHVGLVRYNPFGDTGGDQSFVLALLDAKGHGVVISSLHGRTGTRFYAKPVKSSTSPISLSEEELIAIKQAQEGASDNSTHFISR